MRRFSPAWDRARMMEVPDGEWTYGRAVMDALEVLALLLGAAAIDTEVVAVEERDVSLSRQWHGGPCRDCCEERYYPLKHRWCAAVIYLGELGCMHEDIARELLDGGFPQMVDRIFQEDGL